MVTREVTPWSYGNALYYGLSMLNWEKMYSNACGNACDDALKLATRCIMFIEFEKLPYPLVTSISIMLNVLLHITNLYKYG